MFKQYKNKIIIVAIVAVVLLVVFPVLAQVNVGLEYATATGLGTQDVRVSVAKVIRAVIGLLGIIAVVLVIYGGFIWMTAAGDEEKITKAKKILTAAVIGLIIILSAFAIASFVLNRLLEGTGAKPLPGAPLAPGGPGAGGLPVTAFYVRGMSPQGEVPIRNIKLRIWFNGNVDNGTLENNITVKEVETNNLVVGESMASGNLVEFIPDASCPAPDDRIKCFGENTEYVVEVKGGSDGLKSTDDKELTCVSEVTTIGNGACKGFFKSGEDIDTAGPEVTITRPSNGQLVSVDDFVAIEAEVKDNSGVGQVEFYVDDNLIGRDVPQAATVIEYQAGTDWDTSGLDLKSSHRIKVIAFDIDDNQTTSSEILVTILAAHCFNDGSEPDADETGVDCGGADCRKCAGEDCSNNSECASGACVAGKCINYPTILGVAPANGAVGNYITIQGQYFDDYEADKSKVIFLGESGEIDDKAASLPQACGSTAKLWQKNQIIVEVPPDAKTGPLKVVAKNTYWDDTINERGWQGDFEVNNVERPGLCAINPQEGEFGDTITLQGKNFGTETDAVKFGNISAGGTLAWGGEKIEGATVPDVAPGNVGVSVTVQDEISNSLNFKVKPSGVAPRISDLDPKQGPPGQYVTIFGSNFGTLASEVTFINQTSDVETPAGQPDPGVCGTDYWHNDYINIKVPSVDRGDYKIKVTKEGGQESNQVDFKVIVGSPGPGICRLIPDNGPLGTEVEISGENFGADSNKVKFYDSQENGAISSWNNNTIKVFVPPLAITGPVQVINKNGDLSNKVNFSVGSCSADSCASGKECCGDGSCRTEGSCIEEPPVCTYGWSFTTGKGYCGDKIIDSGEQCDGSIPPPSNLSCDDLGCAGYENMSCDLCGLVCTNAQGDVCPQSCDDDGTAEQGEQCDPPDLRGKSCTNWGFGIATGLGCTTCRFDTSGCRNVVLPKVVRDSECTNNIQSPSPQEDSLENCINTLIAVRFNMDMDDNTLTIPQNIELKKCNSGGPRQTNQCSTESENYRFDGFINQNTEEEGIIIDPTQWLAPDTWYQFILKSGDGGIKNPAGLQLDGNNDDNEGGDFEMYFKTRNSNDPCELDHIVTTPPEKILTVKNATQNYKVVPIASNCNVLPGGGYNWLWASTTPSVASITSNDFDYNNKTDPEQIAVALAEGQTIIRAETLGLEDSGNLTIDFEDVRVVDKWPSCNTACRNAQIGARFNLDMNSATLSQATINLFSCADNTCSAGPLTPVNISRVNYSQADKEVYIIPQVASLNRNQLYRVVIKGGASGVKSVSDTAFVPAALNYDANSDGTNDSYSWHFKTKDEPTLCTVDRVSVSPGRAYLYLIGDSLEYTANAYGSPDECNPNGQRLRAIGYDWGWGSSKTHVADISQRTSTYTSPPAERGDPGQTAVAKGVDPGQTQSTTNIVATTEGKDSQGELTVVCGHEPGYTCRDGNGNNISNTHGVGEDSCCHPRPSVIAKEPTDDPQDQDDDICRNSVIRAIFNKKMNRASLVGNIEVKVSGDGYIQGQTKVEDEGDGSVAIFTPNDYFEGGKTYIVNIKGDSNLADDQVTGVRSETGVGMNRNYTWEFRVKDEICQIKSVEVTISPNIMLSPPASSVVATRDFFSCAGRDNCPDDAKDTKPGSQHNYLAQARDKNNQALAANYEWTRGLDLIDLSASDRQSIDITPKGNNGQTSVMVKAIVDRPEVGSAFKTVDILIFICENPWPSIRTFPYQDIQDPKTNYSTFYCRDAGQGRVCRGGNGGQACTKSEDCAGGACINDKSDDLPPIGKQGAGNVWEPVIVTHPATSEILKEFLMPVR